MSTALINGRRLSAFNYSLIALSWLITVFDGFDMMMVSFTAPFMRDEFGLSKMMLGRVFSAGLVGMMPLAWALNIEFVPVRMRSTIVTVIMMGYSFGTAIAAPMTNWIAPHYGWQGVYLAGGAETLLCALAL